MQTHKCFQRRARWSLVWGMVMAVAGMVPGPGRAEEPADSAPAESPANTTLHSTLPGPFPAQVIKVVDGDTLRASIQIWLGQTTVTSIRVRGVDTPELRGKCAEEKDKALQAKAQVSLWAPPDAAIQVLNVQTDKYGGRVVADVLLPDGRLLRDALIEAGLARPYDGTKRQPWCS